MMIYNDIKEALNKKATDYKKEFEQTGTGKDVVDFLTSLENDDNFSADSAIPTIAQIDILRELKGKNDITFKENWLRWPSLYTQGRETSEDNFYYAAKLMSIVTDNAKLKRYYPKATQQELDEFKSHLYDEAKQNIYVTSVLKAEVKRMDDEEKSETTIREILGDDLEKIKNEINKVGLNEI